MSGMALLIASLTAPTYCKDVAPILQRRCQNCHHPGTAAPFSLLTYGDAVKWADNIVEAVGEQRMPPWFADPKFGHFGNDPRLGEEEKRTLSRWVRDSRLTYGNSKDLPAATEFADGWTIGKPDAVFELPEEQTIPATRPQKIRRFLTPAGFKEDVWIQAVEVRPTNPAVVHHVNIMYRDPAEIEDTGTLIKANPGRMSWTYPEGHARLIKAGTIWNWDVHYESNGKPDQKDRCQLGVVFYRGPTPPKRVHETVGLINGRFRIPPHEAHYEVESMWDVPYDLEVTTLSPHMHLRGSAFQVEIIYPDKVTETILSVPAYDFNWQLIYELRTPLRLTEGCKVHCTAWFDNSAGNENNPDPSKEVWWGNDSSSEMMLCLLDYVAYEGQTGELVKFVDCPHPYISLPPIAHPSVLPNAPTAVARRASEVFPLAEHWWLSALAPVPLLGLAWILWRRRAATSLAKGTSIE
jgi:hypothetical protein